MRIFYETIRELELIDTPLSNAKYKWSNFTVSTIFCRLDRFLFSNKWKESFPFVLQSSLVHNVLDHMPIMLDTKHKSWEPSPFRFDNSWLSFKEFNEKVKEWWELKEDIGIGGYKFLTEHKELKPIVREWDKEHKQKIRGEKLKLQEQIHSLDYMEGGSEYGRGGRFGEFLSMKKYH